MTATVGSQRTVLTTVIAAFMIIAGIFGFCGSIALITGGGIAGVVGSTVGSNAIATDIATSSPDAPTAQQTQAALAQQAQQALNDVSNAGGSLVIFGILELVVGIAFLVTGIGLFQLRPWAYNAAIVITILYVVVGIVEAIAAHTLGVVTLIFPVLAIIVLVLLLTDAGTKRSFGRA